MRAGYIAAPCPTAPSNTPPLPPRDRPAPHLRDHLAPGRRQDHADREVPALRRRHPDGRPGARQGRGAPHPLGLHEARAGARHLGLRLGDVVPVPRLVVQPRRHPRPLGLLRGHLPHADRRRRRGHGDRRRQGRREPDPQALRGLPAARPADPHLLQQDGPRGARHLRDHRRDPARAAARRLPGLLADRPGPRLPRLLRHAARPARADGPRRPQPPRREHPDAGPRRPGAWPSTSRADLLATPARGGGDGARAAAGLRPAGDARRQPQPDLVRLGDQLLRRAGADGRHRRLRPAAGGPRRRAARGRRLGAGGHRLRLQGAGQHGPQAPRPRRLRPALLGPLRARHEAPPRPDRQADGDREPGALPRPGPRARRGRLGRRHHRHPEPRPAPHRRRADRGRGDALHRHPVLRARAAAERCAPATR